MAPDVCDHLILGRILVLSFPQNTGLAQSAVPEQAWRGRCSDGWRAVGAQRLDNTERRSREIHRPTATGLRCAAKTP